MAAMASVGVAVKTLMIILFCIAVAACVYLFVFGDSLSCIDLHARWMILLLGDLSIFVVAFGAWYAYKESSWIVTVILIVPVGYILTQFYKLSPEEFSKDPLYFVLTRRKKRDVAENPMRSFLVTAKIVFSTLGCFALGTMIFTVIVDISPLHVKYFSSCLLLYGIDLFIYVVIFSLWVTYKESSWTTALCWILLLLCFRGLILCIYIVRQLFYLSPHHHASLIIFNDKNRDSYSSDSPLMAHPDE